MKNRHNEPDIEVSFKHEGEERGEPFGPVFVIDLIGCAADPKADAMFMPYGYKPAWRIDKGWLLRSQAVAIAKMHGVTLNES